MMSLWNRKVIVSNNEVTSSIYLTAKQSLLPNALVTALFLLWGFAYGLLSVLNSRFQSALSISGFMASGLSAAYFGAYFICPPTISSWILRRYGFRITFMTGLAVLAIGCLLFWPSGIKKSFGGFCGSMFVVGAGRKSLSNAITTLPFGQNSHRIIQSQPLKPVQTRSSPSVAPPKYSEIRLNLAQAVQGAGSFAAPLLASRVFFANTIDDEQGLRNVQWVYLGVAGFVVLLIAAFFFAPFPEITDADMDYQEGRISKYDPGPFREQYNLFLAIWSQFCYVGAQVSIANYFISFCMEAGKSKAEASDLLAVGQGLFVANRFIAGGLMTASFFRPRYILAVYLGLCAVLTIPAITVSGNVSIAMLILVLCFESACFATIFTLGLRGLGRHTKRGGSLLVAAISGGCVFPPMAGAVMERKSAHVAMAIPLMGFVLAWVYPLYVNVFKRDMMDAHRDSQFGVQHTDDKELQLEAAQEDNRAQRDLEIK